MASRANFINWIPVEIYFNRQIVLTIILSVIKDSLRPPFLFPCGSCSSVSYQTSWGWEFPQFHNWIFSTGQYILQEKLHNDTKFRWMNDEVLHYFHFTFIPLRSLIGNCWKNLWSEISWKSNLHRLPAITAHNFK